MFSHQELKLVSASSNIGLGQIRGRSDEEATLITCGNDVNRISEFARGADGYSARDVVECLLACAGARAVASESPLRADAGKN